MAAIGSTVLTLQDIAKRLDPNGMAAMIIEMLATKNEMLDDMLWQEGNLPTGHQVTQRTGLPTVYWRMINQGTPPSKSQTAQVVEQAAQLEAWSEIDEDLMEINGNSAAYRLGEASAFIEAMNQEVQSTSIYGNAGLAPEEFTGLAPRYSLLSAGNGENIIDAGGTGSDNTSIWLVVWGQNSAMGIFPKGSEAGLRHRDLGLQVVETTAGVGGNRMLAYRDQFKWKTGIALKDWRYVVRIANVDTSLLDGRTGAGLEQDLYTMMGDAMVRIPNLREGNAAFYCNRKVRANLNYQARQAVQSGGQLNYEVVDGKPQHTFQTVPIRTVDAILNTEARVV